MASIKGFIALDISATIDFIAFAAGVESSISSAMSFAEASGLPSVAAILAMIASSDSPAPASPPDIERPLDFAAAFGFASGAGGTMSFSTVMPSAFFLTSSK